MKDEIISKEELKWLSKNVKRKPNYSKCTNCSFGVLKTKKNISCVEFFEKAFGKNIISTVMK